MVSSVCNYSSLHVNIESVFVDMYRYTHNTSLEIVWQIHGHEVQRAGTTHNITGLKEEEWRQYLEQVRDIFGEDICGIQQHFSVAKYKFYRIVCNTRTTCVWRRGRGGERGREGGRGGRGREVWMQGGRERGEGEGGREGERGGERCGCREEERGERGREGGERGREV